MGNHAQGGGVAPIVVPAKAGTLNHRAGVEGHRLGLGSEFVKQYQVTRLVYVETFEDPESAITREKRLKKWNRDWKIRLIEQDNLDWQDLSHLVG